MRKLANWIATAIDATVAFVMMALLMIAFGIFLHTIADAFAPVATTIVVFLVIMRAIRAGWLNGGFAVIGFAVYIAAWPVAYHFNVFAGQAIAGVGVLMGVIALYWTVLPADKAKVIAHFAQHGTLYLTLFGALLVISEPFWGLSRGYTILLVAVGAALAGFGIGRDSVRWRVPQDQSNQLKPL